MIKIYQIHLTGTEIATVNAAEDHAAVPAAYAKSRLLLGAKNFDQDYIQFYSETYEVDTDDLNDAMTLTNSWYDLSKVKGQGYSTSMGDILVKDGVCYIVDMFGFKEIGSYSELFEK